MSRQRPQFSLTAHVLISCAFAGGLLFGGARVHQALAESGNPQGSITVPFTSLPNHGVPLVHVRCNDRVSATFLLDTGSNANLITDALAARLGLTPTPIIKDGQPVLLGEEPARAVTLPQGRLGTLCLNEKQFLVVPARQLSFLPGQPIDGLISINVLADCALALEEPHQLRIWKSGALSVQALKRAGFGDALVVPFSGVDMNGLYGVTAECRTGAAQVTEILIVDTGANQTLISHRAASQLGLRSREVEGKATFSKTLQYVDTARVPIVRLGVLRLTNLLVGYGHDPAVPYPPVLGMDVLSRYRVLIDYPQKKLYFAPLHSRMRLPGKFF